jgi:glucose/arabinose dehydrogenase
MEKLTCIALVVGAAIAAGRSIDAQPPAPTMLDPKLAVRTVVSGLAQPTSIAFSRCQRHARAREGERKGSAVVNGVIQSTILDLAVNNASERGLLGIALHPNFPANPGVYLYWTCTTCSSFAGRPRTLRIRPRKPDRGCSCCQVPTRGLLRPQS